MKKVRINSSNKDSSIIIFVKKNRIEQSKQGFVLMSGHPSYCESIHPDRLYKYYNIPKEYHI